MNHLGHKIIKNTHSIKQKLRSVTLKVSLAGVIFSLMIFLVDDYLQFKKNHLVSLKTLSKIVAQNGMSALTFNDKDAANAVLNSITINPAVQYAGFFDASGNVLKTIGDGSFAPNLIKAKIQTISVNENNSFIEFAVPVVNAENYLGSFIMTVDTNDVTARLWRSVLVLFLTLIVSSILISLLSNKLTLPLINAFRSIVDVFEQITQNQNYKGVAKKTMFDEFNHLVDGFNTMLNELRSRDEQLRKSEERLGLALQASGEGFWDWDLSNGVTFYDDRSHDILGYPRGKLPTDIKQFFELVNPEDSKNLFYLVDAKNEFELEFRLKTFDRKWIWVIVYAKAIEWNENNKVSRLLGTVQDISERHAKDEQRRILSELFQNSQDPTFIFDSDFNIHAVNNALLDLTGLAEKKLLSTKFSQFLSHYQSPVFIKEISNQLLKPAPWEGEIRYPKKIDDGSSKISWLRIRPLGLSVVTKKESFVGEISDLLLRQKIEDELRYLANYDPLTKLPNRRLFTDRFQHALTLAERNNKILGVMFLDLDRFKHINDSLGHSIGDNLLISVAKRLQNIVRESDTLCRLGGDEFTLLLENVTSVEGISELAKKVTNQFIKAFIIDGHEISISTSIGVCVYPQDGNNVESLMKNADAAMYSAKKSGRNRFVYYHSKMNESADERLIMENDLRKAIEQQQFYLVYQPKVDLSNGKISGAEALIRWQHPTKGMISPLDFITLAEETGLIVKIGEWVIETACKQMCEWQKVHQIYINVAVNVSVKQFVNLNFPEKIQTILTNYNLDPKYLQLEVTESMLMENADSAVEMLTNLKQLGLNLAIDDFGTGYSSLQYLGSFPIDCVKIDRSFIIGLGDGDMSNNSDKCETIVRAIIAMAKGLGLEIVAEGIEEDSQAKILKSLNCDYAQGYYFSRPLEEAKFLEFITKDC